MSKLNVFYNNDYTASPESFETTRKSKFVAKRLAKHHANDVNVVDPRNFVHQSTIDELITATHTKQYVDALKTGKPLHLAASSGFEWGASTYDFALAHAHGVVASVDLVIENGGRAGTLSSGLHHASPEHGSGFCTVNGLAVGALRAVQQGRKVMILDFDAHCGGGTMKHLNRMIENGQINSGDIVQVDLSVSGFDMYETNTANYRRVVSLHSDSNMGDDGEESISDSDDEYIEWITDALVAAELRYQDDMIVIYNAGIDPINVVDFGDPMGVLERREELVSSWIADKPSVFTLAGGYKWNDFTLDDIADGHIINIAIWARHLARVSA
jgi:acetoin utilization deacetylase AcuC-like enzyme